MAVEQVFKADTTLGDIVLELFGDLLCALAGQVINALVIVIQADLGQALADAFGLPFQLHGCLGQALGLLVADLQVAAHPGHRLEQAVQLQPIGFGALGNLANLLLDPGGQPGNAVQLFPGMLDLIHAAVQVIRQLADLLDHLRRTVLDVGNHLADLLSGAGGAPGKATHLIGNHGKTSTVITGPGCLDRSVEGQQVGLAGDGLDYQSDPGNILAALVQSLDQFATGRSPRTQVVHALDRLRQHRTAGGAAFMGAAGSHQGLLAQLRGSLLGADHYFGAADDLCCRAQLRLQLVCQLLHRERHAGCRQGVVAGGS
ncbi:hypothetical protein D3C79_551600 [compost metagenome]